MEDGAIECVVKAGVGLLVSFQLKSVIRVYHLETFDHLQDINIASAVHQLLEGLSYTNTWSFTPRSVLHPHLVLYT